MPELPEVETSRRGIEPWLAGTMITKVVVRDRRLRWPIAPEIESRMRGRTIDSVGRRAKYLLVNTDDGTVKTSVLVPAFGNGGLNCHARLHARR